MINFRILMFKSHFPWLYLNFTPNAEFFRTTICRRLCWNFIRLTTLLLITIINNTFHEIWISYNWIVRWKYLIKYEVSFYNNNHFLWKSILRIEIILKLTDTTTCIYIFMFFSFLFTLAQIFYAFMRIIYYYYENFVDHSILYLIKLLIML